MTIRIRKLKTQKTAQKVYFAQANRTTNRFYKTLMANTECIGVNVSGGLMKHAANFCGCIFTLS